jgi:hypothetical protein
MPPPSDLWDFETSDVLVNVCMSIAVCHFTSSDGLRNGVFLHSGVFIDRGSLGEREIFLLCCRSLGKMSRIYRHRGRKIFPVRTPCASQKLNLGAPEPQVPGIHP